MWKAINLSNQKKFFTKFHGIIYYLQKIPFIGNLFSNAHGWSIHFDVAVIPIAFIFNFVMSILTKFLYLVIMILASGYILGIFEIVIIEGNKVQFLFLVTGIILLGIFRDLSYFYTNDRETYTFIKMIRVKAKDYFLGDYFYNIFTHIITYTIALIILFVLQSIGSGVDILKDISVLDIFGLVVFITSIRYLFAYFGLLLNMSEEKSKNLSFIAFGLVLIIFISTLVLIGIDRIIDTSFMYDWKLIPAGILIFCVVTNLMIKNNNIEKLAYQILKVKDFDTAEINDEFISGAKVESKDYNMKEKDFSKYTGMTYLNKLFFHRYKKALFKKTLLGNVIKLGVFGSLIIFQLFLGTPIDPNDAEFITETKKYLPYFAFGISYIAFSGNFFIKFLYYNMDKKLMKHSFYRTPQNVITSIKIRVQKLIKFHLPMFTLFLLNIIIFAKDTYFTTFEIVRTAGFALLGLVFFSFFYLYMYYLIQPFNSEGELSHPVMSFIPYALYMSLFYSASRENSDLILNIIGIICLIFLIVGAVLVYKFAPKRFKTR